MIYAAGDQNSMMEESQEAAMRREELIRMYHTCNDALALIRDVSAKTGTRTMSIHLPSMILSLSLSTVHTPLPPPVQHDDAPDNPYSAPSRGRPNPPPPSRPSRPTSSIAPPARPSNTRSPVPERPGAVNSDRPSVPR